LTIFQRPYHWATISYKPNENAQYTSLQKYPLVVRGRVVLLPRQDEPTGPIRHHDADTARPRQAACCAGLASAGPQAVLVRRVIHRAPEDALPGRQIEADAEDGKEGDAEEE
jgi:hypothetical protein